jgi:sugar lactone lactonase YvrE
VADSYNNRIRKITAGGLVTTLAGRGSSGFADGAGTSAAFYNPWGIAVDESGNVYVGDYGNNRIRKITTGGVVTTLAGSGVAGSADGAGTAAAFYFPTGVTVDVAGNVYVADFFNNSIRKITAGGLVTTLAGEGDQANIDAIGLAAEFYFPTGVAVDVAGNLYVADTFNGSIRKIITY